MPDIENLQPFPSRGGPLSSGSCESSTDGYDAVSITSHTSAHTKGNYTQILASTSKASIGLLVTLVQLSNSYRFMVDIATGAAAAEVVRIPNVFANDGTQIGMMSAGSFFPVYIPAGTRIAARCQDSQGGGNSIQVRISTVPLD